MQAKVVMNRCFDLLPSVFGSGTIGNLKMKRRFSAHFQADKKGKSRPGGRLEVRGPDPAARTDPSCSAQ
jgi:hypothetical protein